MKKTFNYKFISIDVKTNFMKDGKCWFGKDIYKELSEICKELKFEENDNSTTETTLIDIYKELTKRGIKATAVKTSNLEYNGTTMTPLEKNKTL